jgi:hypothetical protein
MPADSDSTFEESFADIGARETYLETDHEDAVEWVRTAFTDTGFGTPTEFSPSENIREHTGEELPATRVISIGDPHAGKIVAEQTQRICHASLLKVFEQVCLAPDNPESSVAWWEAVDIAGSGVAEGFKTLNTSEMTVTNAHAPADG